jgi:hypothetical protein
MSFCATESSQTRGARRPKRAPVAPAARGDRGACAASGRVAARGAKRGGQAGPSERRFADTSSLLHYLFNDALHGDPRHYDPSDPNYHYYRFSNSICSAAEDGCTAQNVFDSLRSYAAPGQLDPAFTGGRVYVPFAGFVRQFVDDGSLSVYNVTAAGHIFDPGYVERSVVASPDGSISIRTTGEGTGPNRLFNLDVARPAFTGLDSLIRLRTIPAANGVQF